MLYIVGYEHEGPVKIGFSNKPKNRISDLQIGFHKPIIVFAVGKAYAESEESPYDPDEYVEDRLAETYLHNRYKDNRVRGEWFNVKPVDIIYDTIGEIDPNCPYEYVSWDVSNWLEHDFYVAKSIRDDDTDGHDYGEYREFFPDPELEKEYENAIHR